MHSMRYVDWYLLCVTLSLPAKNNIACVQVAYIVSRARVLDFIQDT